MANAKSWGITNKHVESKQSMRLKRKKKDMQNTDIVQEFDTAILGIAKLEALQNKNQNKPNLDDFKVEVLINNHMGKVLVDTGAKVSACGLDHAQQWCLTKKMHPTFYKIKPYNSQPIPVLSYFSLYCNIWRIFSA